MAIVDLPTADRDFAVASASLSLSSSKSRWSGFYTGSASTVSHLADRLRLSVTLAKSWGAAAEAKRRAFILSLISTGDWLRMGLPRQQRPLGTLTGAPTLNAAAVAGARSIVLTGVTSGRTLLPGDVIGISGNLLVVGSAGATATSTMTVPLALPLQRDAASGTVVTLTGVTSAWELESDDATMEYLPGIVQGEIALQLRQVVQG